MLRLFFLLSAMALLTRLSAQAQPDSIYFPGVTPFLSVRICPVAYNAHRKTDTRLDSCTIRLYRNGVLIQKDFHHDTALFEYRLDPGPSYVFYIDRRGYSSKNFRVMPARLPPGWEAYHEFAVDIQLLTVSGPGDQFLFEKPSGRLAYDPETDDFDIDQQYSESRSDEDRMELGRLIYADMERKEKELEGKK